VVTIRALLERWMIGRAPVLRVRGYLLRWRMFPRNRWCNAYLHRFRDSDDPVPHDHPYRNVSVILAGRYLEHYQDGTAALRRPGSFVVRGSHMTHWLEVIDGPVWSVFIHGPRIREWGFDHPMRGWIHHETYNKEEGR